MVLHEQGGIMPEHFAVAGPKEAVQGPRVASSTESFRQGFTLILSLAIAALFVRSSISHLSNPYFFLSSIYAYKLTGTTLGFLLALIVPFLQIVIACCVVARIFVSTAFGLAAFLFGTYSIAQASALWRGLNVACGCFGAVDSNPVSIRTVAFVTMLCVCCAAACFLTRTET